MDPLIQRWYDLINIRSVNGRELEIAEHIAGLIRGFGLTPHFSRFEEDVEGVRPSVWTELDSGRPGKTMLLIGHIDTVDVTLENWKTDPFRATEIDGKVYGRGAMDMKGGLACLLSTLEYFAAHPERFSGKILAAFVSDEEGLSRGTYALCDEGVLKADYAVMAECRFTNAAIGFRGRYSFEVAVRGESAHASRYPRRGENALISAGKLAAAIEALPTKTQIGREHV